MSDILESIDWAKNTIKDRLMFGMEDAPLQAAYSRERRASGVLLKCRKEITHLTERVKELEAESDESHRVLSILTDANNKLLHAFRGLEAELQAEREVVDDIVLRNDHMPDCPYSKITEDDRLYDDCKCMDFNYYDYDAIAERARQRQAERKIDKIPRN